MSYQQNVSNFQNQSKNAQASPIDLNVSETIKLYLPDLVKYYKYIIEILKV